MRSHPHSVVVLSLGLTSVLVSPGCAEKPMLEPEQRTVRKIPSEPSEAPEAKPETPPPTETPDMPSAATTSKQEFQETLAANLKALDEQMRELQLKTATLTEEAKAGWAEKQADLTAKRKSVEAKLGEIQSATGEAWEHLREGSQAAWEELEQAVRKARTEF